MQITKGMTTTAPKIMIYGQAGSGKSSLATRFSKPLFLDVEDGLNFLDVEKTKISNLDIFYKDIVELYKGEKVYDTIVIDSIDWLVRKVIEDITGQSSGNTFADKMSNVDLTLNKAGGGYGNGKQMLENHVRGVLLPALRMLTDKGYTVVLIAHAQKKALMDADGFEVEQLAPKIDVNTMNTFMEWCDHIFYLKTDASGNRTIVASNDGVATAKNRLGITGEIQVTDDLNMDDVVRPKNNKVNKESK